MLDISDIGVERFAARAHDMLVDYLRSTCGDEFANWCQDFWTGALGGMYLAHSMYAGCNNNTGVEVSWCYIKKLCLFACSLGQPIGALCHFIKTTLREQHTQRLGEAGNSNAFIRNPVATKDMWDGVQYVYPKTLSQCVVLEHYSKKPTS